MTDVPLFLGVIAKASKAGYKDTYMLVMQRMASAGFSALQNGEEEVVFTIISEKFADGLEPQELIEDIDEGRGIILGRVEDVMGSPVKEAGIEVWKDESIWIPAEYFDCMGESLEGSLGRISDSGLFAVLEETEPADVDIQTGLETLEPLYLDFSTESADTGDGTGSYYYSPEYLGFIFANAVTIVPMRTDFFIEHIEVTEVTDGELEIVNPVVNPEGQVTLMNLRLDVTGLPEAGQVTAQYGWTGYLTGVTFKMEGTGSLDDVAEFVLYRYQEGNWLLVPSTMSINYDERTITFYPPLGEWYLMDFELGERTELRFDLYFTSPATGTYKAVWEKNCHMLVATANPIGSDEVSQQIGFIPVSVSGAPIPALDEEQPELIRGGTACFIATAAFGSPFEKHVQMLREFRDRYLLTNTAGKAFVRWYYSHSPKCAAVIAHNEALRAATRIALMPVYAIAFLLMKGIIPYLMLGAGVFLLAMRKKRVKTTIVLLAVSLLFVFSSAGFAADTNHFKVAPGENYTVVVPTTDTVGRGKAALDFFYTYADSPLEVVIGGTTEDLVKNQHLLNAALTVGIGERGQISVTMPYSVSQDSDIAGVDDSGIGDVIISAKYRFNEPSVRGAEFATAKATGFGIALSPYLQLPTGNEDAFMGAESASGGVRLIIDAYTGGNLRFFLNAGYAYQDKEELVQIDIDHSLLFGAGFTYLFSRNTFISAEVYGRSEELFESEQTPVEGIVSWGYENENTSFVIGGGGGLVKGYGASGWRLFPGFRFGM